MSDDILAKNFLLNKTCYNCAAVHSCGIYYSNVREKFIPAAFYTCKRWSKDGYITEGGRWIEMTK